MNMGHNSKMISAAQQLRSFIERVERLSEEKATIQKDITAVFAEAKSSGFDPKILRKVLAFRKKDPAEREQEQSMLDLYLAALGMTLLEEAIERAGE